MIHGDAPPDPTLLSRLVDAPGDARRLLLGDYLWNTGALRGLADDDDWVASGLGGTNATGWWVDDMAVVAVDVAPTGCTARVDFHMTGDQSPDHGPAGDRGRGTAEVTVDPAGVVDYRVVAFEVFDQHEGPFKEPDDEEPDDEEPDHDHEPEPDREKLGDALDAWADRSADECKPEVAVALIAAAADLADTKYADLVGEERPLWSAASAFLTVWFRRYTPPAATTKDES